MRVAVYSPYLDSIGGGERYMLTIAEALSKDSDVDLLLDVHLNSLNTEQLKNNLSKRLNMDLSKVALKLSPLGAGGSSIKRIAFLKKYDFFFCLTDGSIFYSTAKKNILHIQTPIISSGIKNIKNKIYLKSWDLIIYNSKFTKENVIKNWPIKSIVLYPPVDVSTIKPLKKKKYILNVGRFFGFLREKKHALMIKAFTKLVDEEKLKDWSLNLVGSASDGDKPYLEELKQLAKGYDINFFPNLSFEKLVKMYGEASIYWHAMGYLEKDPTKMEHFGITTVEAMAAGCVPVVINLGGQREIVDNKSGFLWDDTDQLIKHTLDLIKKPNLMDNLSKGAEERSHLFSKEEFISNIKDIVYGSH